MISLVSLIVFFAFFVLYNTSKKAVLSNHYPIEKWIGQNPKPSRFMGLGILVLAYCALISFKAIGASSLIFVIQIMTLGSLIVLLAPLKIINYKFVLGLTILTSLFEIYS